MKMNLKKRKKMIKRNVKSRKLRLSIRKMSINRRKNLRSPTMRDWEIGSTHTAGI
jgi:hypothetical protein